MPFDVPGRTRTTLVGTKSYIQMIGTLTRELVSAFCLLLSKGAAHYDVSGN